MSNPDSPYFCHNLIDTAAYMLHIILDLRYLGERKEEATRAAAAEMASRAATTTASASGTGIGS